MESNFAPTPAPRKFKTSEPLDSFWDVEVPEASNNDPESSDDSSPDELSVVAPLETGNAAPRRPTGTPFLKQSFGRRTRNKTMSFQLLLQRKVKTSEELKSWLGRDSLEGSDNDLDSRDEASDDTASDDMEDAFAITTYGGECASRGI